MGNWAWAGSAQGWDGEAARALAVEAAAGGSRALTARTAGALEVLEVRCWRRPVETSRAPGVAVEAREELC